MNVKIDVTNIILKTDRLILRAFRETDLDDFYAYASVPGVGEMAGWEHHKSKEDSKQILNAFLEKKNVFAIVCKESLKVIGSLGLEAYNESYYEKDKNKRGIELGYVLAKNYWGCGLMTEAIKEVIRYLFKETKLDFITCGHFLDNYRSKRVIEKAGFRYVGECIYEGGLGKRKACTYQLRKEEYFDEKN